MLPSSLVVAKLMGTGADAAENRHDVELALQASRWLGSAVLQPTRERSAAPTGVR